MRPDQAGVNDSFRFQDTQDSDPTLECLGLKFPNDQARREHFLSLLREKLKDPEFRKIEGFPIGSDEDILAMSDPPYYTACPNPFLEEFIKRYGKPYSPFSAEGAGDDYHREPFAVDVSVGKTDPIYKAHAYHTKVPHLAIVPSILHYTEPGDIVLDGFAGSGMTGVAAQWCGSAPAKYRHELEAQWRQQGRAAPKWGARRVILNELSPAATFIAANYNLPFDVEAFATAGRRLLKEVEQELGWMYETLHTDGKTRGRIEYTVWSEVFTCPHCAGEVVFLNEALDQQTKRIREIFPCPQCSAELTKRRMEKLYESHLDAAISGAVKTPKRKPVLICYTIAGRRYEKLPDAEDLAILLRVKTLGMPRSMPITQIPTMHMTHERARMDTVGITHIHHFYLPRAVQVLSGLWRRATGQFNPSVRSILKFWLDSHLVNLSVQNRYRPEVSFPYNPLTGVYYVSALISEASPFTAYENKLKRIAAGFRDYRPARGNACISCVSATSIGAPDSCVDYIFTDPPFGENIYYADLNFLVESWHRVTTDAKPEAIVDRFKKKGLFEYQHLMQRCFAEYYRVLKPGRWMTVVFSNSRATVWNAIQVALQQAGFVVAEVSALDKQQGSYRQVTSTTAVKQDLVISAYKPNGGLEERFSHRGPTADSAWDFVESHLKRLRVVKPIQGGGLEMVAERDPRRIFDRMVAWFVRNNAPVPLSSQEFQAGLRQRFVERDGMIFLPEQTSEYDRWRLKAGQAPQMELFVSDERSAIDWLTDFLKTRPSTYQEIHPEFIGQLGAGWRKHETRPELSALLEDNFLRYDGESNLPSQIHSYLSTNFKPLRGLDKSDPLLIAKARHRWYVPDPGKAQDLEKRREKALLKEFEGYRAHAGRRLREFRLEAMRAGFKHAWTNRDYATIIAVAHKIPEQALQEDEKLLLWYDQALTRTEAGA